MINDENDLETALEALKKEVRLQDVGIKAQFKGPTALLRSLLTLFPRARPKMEGQSAEKFNSSTPIATEL